MKSAYRVPSMSEINAVPWNGLKVVSTFSGCGGSCLGYRMAGFRVIWANEFVPAAQASYRANMEPEGILDGRDIRSVMPEEILEATKLKAGELDLLDGSPPCQAFSTAGVRQKSWNKAKQYEHGAHQCNEQLFIEYIRLLRTLQSKTFIAENVSGLVKGVSKGFFLEILAGLKACGYKVKACMLNAAWLGVPQHRERIIYCGVRKDLAAEPMFPKPFDYYYTVREVLEHIDLINSHVNKWQSPDRPHPTILSSGATITPSAQMGGGGFVRVVHHSDGFYCDHGTVTDSSLPTVLANRHSFNVENENGVRKLTIAELKRLCSFPDDFVLIGTYSQQWERLGNSVPPLMMKAIAETVRDRMLLV
jgi:DNA (cytosine-5)-methyltransferase 1